MILTRKTTNPSIQNNNVNQNLFSFTSCLRYINTPFASFLKLGEPVKQKRANEEIPFHKPIREAKTREDIWVNPHTSILPKR